MFACVCVRASVCSSRAHVLSTRARKCASSLRRRRDPYTHIVYIYYVYTRIYSRTAKFCKRDDGFLCGVCVAGVHLKLMHWLCWCVGVEERTRGRGKRGWQNTENTRAHNLTRMIVCVHRTTLAGNLHECPICEGLALCSVVVAEAAGVFLALASEALSYDDDYSDWIIGGPPDDELERWLLCSGPQPLNVWPRIFVGSVTDVYVFVFVLTVAESFLILARIVYGL